MFAIQYFHFCVILLYFHTYEFTFTHFSLHGIFYIIGKRDIFQPPWCISLCVNSLIVHVISDLAVDYAENTDNKDNYTLSCS